MKPSSKNFGINRTRKVGIAIFSLVMIACITTCFTYPMIWEKYKSTYLQSKKQMLIDQVMQEKYPDASFVQAKASVQNSLTGDWLWIFVWVRFKTSDTFSNVFDWYKAHPGNIHPFERSFPEQGGLEKVGVTETGEILFEIENYTWVRCLDLLCPLIDEEIP